MGLRINTNVQSISAQRALSTTRENLSANLRKLSSGERITKAGDDAAGLAISENLKSHIRGMRQAKRNVGDAVSMIQVAEGSLSEVSNLIIRLRELSVQSATDTIGDKERGFIDIEFQNLKEEIERIARSAEFNGVKLLDGTQGQLEFQIGINNDPFKDRLLYDSTFNDSTIAALGINAESVATKQGAQNTLRVLDTALVKVNGIRAGMGAVQNRLSSVESNLGISDENLSAANSRIRDTDVASEMADFTKNNILLNSGTSILGQANQFPKIALKLLE